MSDYTTNGPPTEWDQHLGASVGHSRRSTTSSRLPGREIVGTVAYHLAGVVPCEACGHLRRASAHPHSVTIQRRGDRFMRVDCIGREVEP